MNITFLIGNGFDLNCGLKSGYDHACKAFLASKVGSTEGETKLRKCMSKRIDLWGDFEMGIPTFAKEIGNPKELVNGKRAFESFLRGYLTEEQIKFWERFNYEEKYSKSSLAVRQEMLRSFREFYMGISPNVDNLLIGIGSASYSVISLNYTNIIPFLCRDFLGNDKRPIKVNSVHGTLSTGIILGINDESQINPEFVSNSRIKRSLIKPILNATFDNQRVDDAFNTLNESNIICVYGASLGESDLLWRNIIIDWLLDDSNNHLFYYDYNYHNVLTDSIDEKLDIEEDAKENLFLKWNMDEEMSVNVFDQVHIPIGKNIFNIDQVLNASIETSK